MSLLKVEVVYALPEHQTIVALELEEGTTVREAVIASGILRSCPEIDLEATSLGIWSQRVALDRVVRDGDRVEIYRPLIADPKVIRRQQASKGK